MTESVNISFEHNHYEILIERGLLERAGVAIRAVAPHSRAAVIADAAVQALYGEALEASLTRAGYNVVAATFPPGEEHKRAETVLALYQRLVDHGMERGSPIMALGGGVAGDLVGFVAATYLRGVPFVQVPTTLLAMVDASVGGKVGFNLPQGKNLVGAFYQPRAVLIDPSVLITLPEREFRSGLAECVKHAVLADANLFDWIGDHLEAVRRHDSGAVIELIARNVRIKADVVMADEKESGVRAHLNLGHTFAHAIEANSGYGVYSHGEAVALGLCAAAKFALGRKLCDASVLSKTTSLLQRIGLPVKGRLAGNDALTGMMLTDKKVKDGAIRLVLPTSIGTVTIVDDATGDEIAAAWDSIRQP